MSRILMTIICNKYHIKLTVLMLKKDRSSTKVIRSKFIDRIKSTVDYQSTHKQNVDLNDIRQSSYKLPKSKSSTRYDHSLQRKSPIQIKKETHQAVTSFNNIQQLAAKYGSQTITINNTIKLATQYSSQKQLDEEGEGRIVNGINMRKNQLRQEEQALDDIKVIWDKSARLKEKQYFKIEMDRIQNILKDIIIAMAKPKFQSFSQNLNIHPEASLKLSPFHDLTSVQQSKEASNLISADYLCGKGAQVNYESEAEQDIEFKKIMYILQQKSKLPKSKSLSQKSLMSQPTRQLKEINSILNKNTSYQSSFNCSSRQLSGHTIRQIEKFNSSHTNDKVFLKNIVKKAKGSVSNLQSVERESHSKKSRSDFSLSKSKSNEDCEYEGEYSSLGQQKILQQYEQHEQTEEKQNLEPCYSKNKRRTQIQQTSQTLQDDSESKRAVLNQIIGMLNKKYHKNIKLQPRQF